MHGGALNGQHGADRHPDPVRPDPPALRKDADPWPVGAVARVARSRDLIGLGDEMELIDDLHVGEIAETKQSVGRKSIAQLDRRGFTVPVIIERFCPTRYNMANRSETNRVHFFRVIQASYKSTPFLNRSSKLQIEAVPISRVGYWATPGSYGLLSTQRSKEPSR